MAALLVQGGFVFVCGCIFLASSAAFNALVGAGILLQMISFAMPAALLVWNKRSSDYLPADRTFKLPSIVGWIANTVTIFTAVLELVFFILPASLPVTGSNMSEFESLCIKFMSNCVYRLCVGNLGSNWHSEYYQLVSICGQTFKAHV